MPLRQVLRQLGAVRALDIRPRLRRAVDPSVLPPSDAAPVDDVKRDRLVGDRVHRPR